MNVSIRCGAMFHFRQIRDTLENEAPNQAAIDRADQCEIPSSAGGLPSLARVSTTSASSSITEWPV
ncbi:hypothetical protein HC749_13905 [Arthrobacter sp. S13_S34]|nr:hypothetical protein [Arthrobacter sp. S13_S34]